MNSLKEISLNELLTAREQRVQNQNRLVNMFKENLVSFTVNIPGKFKDTELSRRIHKEGIKILKSEFDKNNIKIIYDELIYNKAGQEAYIVTNEDALELKNLLVNIEEKHPLGKIFDFDVIDKNLNNITRSSINFAARKCYICDEDAHICTRSQKHSYEDLKKKIYLTAYEYFDNN